MAESEKSQLLDSKEQQEEIHNVGSADWVELIRDREAFRILYAARDYLGTEELYRVRENLVVRIIDDQFQSGSIEDAAIIPGHLNLVFKLAGKNTLHFPDGQNVELVPGSLLVGYSGEEQFFKDETHGSGKYVLAMISMRPDVLTEPPFSFSQDSLPDFIKGVFSGLPEAMHLKELRFDLNIKRCLQDLLNCTFCGSIRRAFVEAKVIELVCLSMRALTDNEASKCRKALSVKDCEQLEGLRGRLQEQMANPPMLAELARQVGMSEAKLKRNFKSFFGMTIGEYVQQVRMSRAQELLSAHEGNISYVANALGYDYVSSFIAAFKRHYGLTPKAYQKQMIFLEQ